METKTWYEIETRDFKRRMELRRRTLEEARETVDAYERDDIRMMGATPGYRIIEVICSEREV